MKQINLLPQKIRERQVHQQTTPLLLLAFILGIAAVFSVWVSLKGQVDIVQAKVETLQEQDQLITVHKTSIAPITVDADLVSRIHQLNTYSATEIDWLKAIHLVGSLIPKDLQLTSFSLATTNGNLTLHMVGIAPSNLSFAVFAQSLQSNVTIKDARVEAYNFAPAKGQVSFSIVCTLPFSTIKYPS